MGALSLIFCTQAAILERLDKWSTEGPGRFRFLGQQRPASRVWLHWTTDVSAVSGGHDACMKAIPEPTSNVVGRVIGHPERRQFTTW
jgi:hypothetical protein